MGRLPWIVSAALLTPFLAARATGFQEWDAILPVTTASCLTFYLVDQLIPSIQVLTAKAGLSGRDLAKTSSEQMYCAHSPEALGIVPATIYILMLMMSQAFLAQSQEELTQYNAVTLSVCFMTLLGFADDVLNLRWRYKLLLPSIASLPLLMAYTGTTAIVVPKMLRGVLGLTVELGVLYKVYMGMLAVFCTNAINIYAGINGLEAGQSFVIACSVLTHNFIVMHTQEVALHITDTSRQQHLLSIALMLPLTFSILALLKHNRYPAKVFVGDTFCYFAGMSFATCGIIGHYSKTLMLFFLPQIVNFLLSVPQLIGIYKCPRHRVPRFDPETKKMHCVREHHTLINLYLYFSGPLDEATLVNHLLVLQMVCCLLAFLVRYEVASFFY